MKILFIHETEYIKKVVFEYQIIPELLASRGHDVWVIDYSSNWKKSNLFDFGSLRPSYLENVRRANKKKGVTLIRPGVVKIPWVGRALAFLVYWWLIPRTLKKHGIDCIVLYAVPTNGLPTIYWAKKLKIPVFFRLFDVLHEIVPLKILRGITYQLERIIYRHVQAFAATTPKLTAYGVAMGAPTARTFCLPTGSDLDLFYPKPKDPTLMKRYGLTPTDTVICFAGTLYNFSGLDYLITYLGKNSEELEGIKLLICGVGEQEAALHRLVRYYQLESRVILTGLIQYEDLADYINLSDVGINLFRVNNLTKDIIPAKIYQYLGCRKPIIATRLPGMVNVFPEGSQEHPIFYCYENDPRQFFALLRKIQKSTPPDTNLSLQAIAEQYEATLTQLVEESYGA